MRKPVGRSRQAKPEVEGDTEQRILEAARRVFIRRGTAGARMQEIAAEAGVNQALLHYYFRSKERLSAAVFGQVGSRLFPSLIQILGADVPLEAKINRIIEAYLDTFSRHPFLPGYLLSEMHHHPERVAQMLATATGGDPRTDIARVFETVSRQIKKEVKAKRMRPIAAEQFVVNLISLCIFPFAARPMLGFMLGMDAAAFARFIDERKRQLPDFFHSALQP